MLRGYRCIGFAALLTASALSAQQANNASSGRPSTRQSGEARQGVPTQIAPAIDRIADELAETPIDQSDPFGDERNKREKRDIIAQEESVQWARWNFIAIVFQTFLAGGALIALVLDLRQNRKSVEAQLRAYCSLLSGNFVNLAPDYEPGFDMAISNSGQTPAFKMKIDSECFILENGKSPVLVDPDMTGYTTHTIGAGGNVHAKPNLGNKISSEDWSRLIDGNCVFWVRVFGEYYDIFGKRQTFRVTAAVRGLPDQAVLKPANDGNYFT